MLWPFACLIDDCDMLCIVWLACLINVTVDRYKAKKYAITVRIIYLGPYLWCNIVILFSQFISIACPPPLPSPAVPLSWLQSAAPFCDLLPSPGPCPSRACALPRCWDASVTVSRTYRLIITGGGRIAALPIFDLFITSIQITADCVCGWRSGVRSERELRRNENGIERCTTRDELDYETKSEQHNASRTVTDH